MSRTMLMSGRAHDVTPPVLAWTPSIGGSPTITPGTWTDSPARLYTLYRDGVAVGSQTGKTLAQANAYVTVAADIGAVLKWREYDPLAAGEYRDTNTQQYSLVSQFAPTALFDETHQTINAGKIQEWDDATATYKFSSTAAGNRPLVATLSGLAAMQYIAGTTHLRSDLIAAHTWAEMFGTGGGCMFLVLDETGITVQADNANYYQAPAWVSTTTSGGIVITRSTSGFRGTFYNGAGHNTAYAAPGGLGKVLVQFSYDGATGTLRVNGGGAVTTACAGPLTLMGGAAAIGANYQLTVAGVDGIMGSLVARNTAPSAAQIADARAFFSYKYGVAS